MPRASTPTRAPLTPAEMPTPDLERLKRSGPKRNALRRNQPITSPPSPRAPRRAPRPTAWPPCRSPPRRLLHPRSGERPPARRGGLHGATRRNARRRVEAATCARRRPLGTRGGAPSRRPRSSRRGRGRPGRGRSLSRFLGAATCATSDHDPSPCACPVRALHPEPDATRWVGAARAHDGRGRRYGEDTGVEGSRSELATKDQPVAATWCRRGDSNPHGLPHTPLKRARLPVPPLRRNANPEYTATARG